MPSYTHKIYYWKRVDTQSSNCTYNFQRCWYKNDCIHLHQEHIHLPLYDGKILIVNSRVKVTYETIQ